MPGECLQRIPDWSQWAELMCNSVDGCKVHFALVQTTWNDVSDEIHSKKPWFQPWFQGGAGFRPHARYRFKVSAARPHPGVFLEEVEAVGRERNT